MNDINWQFFVRHEVTSNFSLCLKRKNEGNLCRSGWAQGLPNAHPTLQVALRQRKGEIPVKFLRIFSCCCINNSKFFIHGASAVWITFQNESTFVPYTLVSTLSQSWTVALAFVNTYCLVQHSTQWSFPKLLKKFSLLHGERSLCPLYRLPN